MPEREFKLPDLGEGLTEGEVVRWLVAAGDAIALNQPIVEVETAKAVVEIPAPYAGTVVKLHAGEGDTLDVGAPLISVDTGGGAAGGPKAAPAEAEETTRPAQAPVAAEPEQELQATLVGPGERQQVRRRRIGGHARSANGPRAAVDNREQAASGSATLPLRGAEPG
ncbi:MAG TPA: biotin/lipoyl-containing protein, partial [Actinomycetota bacterium]|nr:biotin/lipoyl-containing protein [Actinomycetota bacterium]